MYLKFIKMYHMNIGCFFSAYQAISSFIGWKKNEFNISTKSEWS